ncbi:hypothetical protein J5N97_024995 [Dioscorea zingiberensis]|uniref:Uncharacterized protein n=1 Tax=Dioscorea zingiberensis TaxID=325984 RepID=A0A9D5C858_9LILI|nr:hypothetical protein J5N97_024995 [Dioscorea zingiberensis]
MSWTSQAPLPPALWLALKTRGGDRVLVELRRATSLRRQLTSSFGRTTDVVRRFRTRLGGSGPSRPKSEKGDIEE